MRYLILSLLLCLSISAIGQAIPWTFEANYNTCRLDIKRGTAVKYQMVMGQLRYIDIADGSLQVFDPLMTWRSKISGVSGYGTIQQLKDSIDYWVAYCDTINGGSISDTCCQEVMRFSVTYSELTTHITNNNLIPGRSYVITDFASNHRPPNTLSAFGFPNTIITPSVEPIMVTATSDSTISEDALSLLYPQDILRYEPFPIRQVARAMSKGLITYREDTQRNISAGYDWRNVRVRRFECGAPGDSLFLCSTPTDPGAGWEDVLTLQNLDARLIANVHLPAMTDSSIERIYTATGGLIDPWNNVTVLKFPTVSLPAQILPEGNIVFHSNVYKAHFDFATVAETGTKFDNCQFWGDVRDVKVYSDTTDSYGTFADIPLWLNAYFADHFIDSDIKNSSFIDVRFNANLQTFMANSVFFDHMTAFSNWGVSGTDTIYMDSVYMYLTETGAITGDGSGDDVSRYRNVRFSTCELEDMPENRIRNTFFDGCEITISANDNWATTDPTESHFVNWKGGYLRDCSWEDVTIGPASGRVRYSNFEYVTASTVNFNTTAVLIATGDGAQDVTILNTTFIAVDSLTISAVDTLTGGLENVNFFATASGFIGVPINECDFYTEFVSTFNIQTGTFDGNEIRCILSDNPTLPVLWTGTNVRCFLDDTSAKVAVWWDNGVGYTSSTTGF